MSRSKRDGRYYDEFGSYLYLHGTYGTEGITEDIFKEQAAVIKDGVRHAPMGPGVEVDEEMLKCYATSGLNPIVVKDYISIPCHGSRFNAHDSHVIL